MGKIIGVRGSLFIDIDGTMVDSGTDEPLPFAIEKINKAYDDGYMIILTTLRGEGYAHNSRFACQETLSLLRLIGVKYHHIIWNCPSPRIVFNDEGAEAVKHPSNSSWEKYEF
jgi:hypothetical protein